MPKCRYLDRRDLWNALRHIDSASVPWLVVGDFSIICNNGEMVDRNPRPLVVMGDFTECLDCCGLLDLPVRGRKMYWCNGQQRCARSRALLDRALMNVEFLREYPSAYMEYLSRKSLDHAPMLI